jgi:chromosomal replication initiation ATPase DnaA
MNERHKKELKRLHTEIIKPKCKINDTSADWKDAMRVACQMYGVTPDQVVSQNRIQHILYARHLFCYICKRELQMTLVSIGRILHRDHSTIINAINVYDDLLKYDRNTRSNWGKVVALLGNYLHKRIVNQHPHIEILSRSIESQ